MKKGFSCDSQENVFFRRRNDDVISNTEKVRSGPFRNSSISVDQQRVVRPLLLCGSVGTVALQHIQSFCVGENTLGRIGDDVCPVSIKFFIREKRIETKNK